MRDMIYSTFYVGYLYFGVVTRMDDDSKLVVCKIDEVWTGRRAL